MLRGQLKGGFETASRVPRHESGTPDSCQVWIIESKLVDEVTAGEERDLARWADDNDPEMLTLRLHGFPE